MRARGRAHEPARCSSRSNRRTWNMRRVAAQHTGCHHPYAPLGRSNVAHHLRARARWRVSGSPELAIDVFRGMGAKRGAGPPQNARRRAWRARLRSAHEVPPCFAGAVQSTGRPHDFVETVWACHGRVHEPRRRNPTLRRTRLVASNVVRRRAPHTGPWTTQELRGRSKTTRPTWIQSETEVGGTRVQHYQSWSHQLWLCATADTITFLNTGASAPHAPTLASTDAHTLRPFVRSCERCKPSLHHGCRSSVGSTLDSHQVEFLATSQGLARVSFWRWRLRGTSFGMIEPTARSRSVRCATGKKFATGWKSTPTNGSRIRTRRSPSSWPTRCSTTPLAITRS